MITYQPETGCFQLSGLSEEKMAIVSIYQQRLTEMLHLAIEDLCYEQRSTRPRTMYEIGLVYWYGQHEMPRPTVAIYRASFDRLYKKEDFLRLDEAKIKTIVQVFANLNGITVPMLSVALLKISELPNYQQASLLQFRKRYRGIHGQVVNRLINFFYPEKEKVGVLEIN